MDKKIHTLNTHILTLIHGYVGVFDATCWQTDKHHSNGCFDRTLLQICDPNSQFPVCVCVCLTVLKCDASAVFSSTLCVSCHPSVCVMSVAYSTHECAFEVALEVNGITGGIKFYFQMKMHKNLKKNLKQNIIHWMRW